MDLGCGDGKYLLLFSSSSVGIDNDEKALKICERKGLKIKKWDLNLSLPFTDEVFDMAFASHILEHVQCPYCLLKESYRVFKKVGD